jgi:PPM family protein phosphatase
MSQTALWKKCLENASLSDLGLRRANNQDSFTVFLAGSQSDFTRRGHLFMVADGMGAHAAGELASKIATDVVPLTYHKLHDQSPPEALAAALRDANTQINTRGQASPEFKGMGTTATVLVILPQGALLGHVGDSRAYRVRGEKIDQLTFDHSLVWELQASNQKYEEQLSQFIGKNIITRSLGPNLSVQIDLEGPHPCQAGDTFLLCTDGLSGQVEDAEIGAVLACLPPAEAVQALVDLANLRGGPDNITVVCARVLDSQIAEDSGGHSAGSAGGQNALPVHPLIWTILGMALLATLGFWAIGQWAASLVALLAAAITGIIALVKRYGREDIPVSSDGRRFGRGPYVSCDCAPSEDFITKLIEIVDQLRDAAVSENWKIDWNGFKQLLASANSAHDSADLTTCARQYLRSISFMMSELKRQHPRGDDSASH